MEASPKDVGFCWVIREWHLMGIQLLFNGIYWGLTGVSPDFNGYLINI